MKPIYIVTDSTADLQKEDIERYNIHVVPLTIQIDDKSYVDGVDIEPEQFLSLMAEAKDLPKSSQPAAGVFKELYDELGKHGAHIISIHMTGGMSGTVKSAESAAEMTSSEVTVIDSQFISHALSFQVIEAAKMAQEGSSVGAIVERIKEIKKSTTLYVVVDKLDNLVKGGRVGKGRAFIGALLNIKPIFTLTDGVLTPVTQARNHRQVVKHLFNAFKDKTAGKIIKKVGLSHAHGLQMAEPLKKLIQESGFQQVPVTFTAPIISTHTGEGAIGFMFYAE